MIDRLEMTTDADISLAGHQKFTRWGGGYTSKIIAEDEEIKELKMSEGGLLYKNLFVLSSTTNKRTGEVHEDPVRFYVFGYPKFNQNKTHKYKIVCNPSHTPIGELISFIYTNFDHEQHVDETQFSKQFKLGRVDFAIDITDHTVDELRRMIYVANKTRKHTSIFKLDDDGAGFLRIISAKEPETIYIGKGDVVLRIYNKVLEARNQVAVCKREGRAIPARLQQTADAACITRIELQIRSIATAGQTMKDGKVIEKKQQRGFHRLRSLWDLLNIKPGHCDMFGDVLFDPTTVTDYFDSDWMNKAFNALIATVGMDEAVKTLPPDKRREIKHWMTEKKFRHDLGNITYKDIKQWLSS